MSVPPELVRQLIHPLPYRHPTKPLEECFPIQIAPPTASSDTCPWARSAFKRAYRQMSTWAAEEGEWVSRLMPEIPYDRIVDRDVILLGLAELWLARVSLEPIECPWVNARHLGVSYVAAHSAKQWLMSYDGVPIRVSAAWPDHVGHKIFLDRVRKLNRAGLLALHPDPLVSGVVAMNEIGPHKLYLAALTQRGFARVLYIERRLRSRTGACDRLIELLDSLEAKRLP